MILKIKMCYHDVDVDVLAAGELHPHPSGHHARRGVLLLHDCGNTWWLQILGNFTGTLSNQIVTGFKTSWVVTLIYDLAWYLKTCPFLRQGGKTCPPAAPQGNWAGGHYSWALQFFREKVQMTSKICSDLYKNFVLYATFLTKLLRYLGTPFLVQKSYENGPTSPR